MLGLLNGLFRDLGMAQNSAELISKEIKVQDASDARIVLPRSKGHIEFTHVDHQYENSSRVINDLSLIIKPGEKVGIVGRSGAGKTTLMKLLLRLYNINSGEILIDGQDITAVTQHSLRESFGVVTQDSALLHRSVADNIILGQKDIRREAVISGCKTCQRRQIHSRSGRF